MPQSGACSFENQVGFHLTIIADAFNIVPLARLATGDSIKRLLPSNPLLIKRLRKRGFTSELTAISPPPLSEPSSVQHSCTHIAVEEFRERNIPQGVQIARFPTAHACPRRRMMAAEPSINNSADVSASSEPRLIIDAQHGDLHPPTLNGPSVTLEDIANKRITNVEDQINSADVSVSGGSDTEASRAEWAKQKDGDKGHGRTGSSTKRPATFKAVSVNKTFLASKSGSTGVSSKPSDKPVAGSSTPPTGSATLSISRPRLVAKTGSGAGASSPRFSSALNGGKAATAPDASAVWNKNRPTPAPEPKKFTDEELKKYGIHMASRLNEDDAQGQNKWADIDEDDEDWAPEAITWGDGTKTTLPHSDEPPVPVAVSDNGSVASKGAIQDKPASPALSGPSSAPAPKSGGLPSGKGLILKSATQEKPTLVAKPPVPPTPAKSPWATLPPVDKTPLVPIEPSYASRGPPREQSSLKPANLPSSREITTDDYNRSAWRDRAPHGNRELFNSRSGRYEPVADRRGPPVRSDSQTRYPGILQRASQSDQPEPSAAFQTNRAAQDVPFGRRRGSSNVSGGSGSFLQRMTKGNDGPIPPTAELLDARRNSLAGSIESPISPGVVSVSGQGQPRPPPDWASRPSPGTTFVAPHRGPHTEYNAGPPPPLLEDDIEYQKKLMREGVELARKRRQEEEAREEAARRERIQKKLDALGPPPERKSEVKDNTAKENTVKPAQIQQRAASETTELSAQALNNEGSDKGDVAVANHHDKSVLNSKETSPTNVLPPESISRRLSHGQDAKPGNVWGGSGPRPDRFTPWVAAAPRNVWSSPDSDRGLGNGTFNPDLGRIPGTSIPAPLGLRSSRYATPAVSGAPGIELASKWVAAVAENDKKLSAARLAERAERERQMAEHGMTMEDAQPAIKDTWRPVHVPGDGTRHSMATVEVQSHPAGPWKASRDELPQGAPPVEEPVSGAQPGVIGSGGNSVLAQAGPAGTPQSRPSRFFPAKDARSEAVYEGDVTHPHVSLPKPHPVVKLPPSMAESQPPQPKVSNVWANRAAFRDSPRAPIHQAPSTRPPAEAASENWQDKINNLLNSGKHPSPKHTGVDAASKNALDYATSHDTTTVFLPVAIKYGWEDSKAPTTKPMAEECFEEQEMGSLPQIRFPHKAPEAAWQPATVPPKPLPKKFLIEALAKEQFHFPADIVGNGTAVIIHFLGMAESKILTIPFSATRGGRGGHSKPSPRHRGGPGHGSRSGKRETSNTYGDSDNSRTTGRSGRGGYRSRGGAETWSRYAPSQKQTSMPA
ncbi:hypothetical protein PT974_00490 [Cladobotryum mycophilum]|uniref:Uncharacterized protein n=1 Tax=Cladobotryum mycophilum TaxID=491253 RepID=A0ABR0T174_9HYPO